MDWHRVGRIVRALRHRRRLTQRDLGRLAGCSASVISRLEAGRSGACSVRLLERIVTALAARLVVSVDWRSGELDRLLDEDHALLQTQWAALRGRSRRWDARQEVTYNHYGDRGAIDDLSYDPATGTLLVTELKTRIYEAHRTAAKLDEKVRLGASIARRFGWDVRRVVGCLVVADMRTNRRRVDAASGVLARYDCRGVSAKRWLRDPVGPVGGLLMFVPLSDVRRGHVRHSGRQRVRPPRVAASVDRSRAGPGEPPESPESVPSVPQAQL